MSNDLVIVKGLRFARSQRAIFTGIDVTIKRGSVTAIMGPSGCGKTTLLRLIGGSLKPTAGSIQVDGQEVTELSRKKLYKLRRHMGMLFQSGALFTNISVFDNVAFPLREQTRMPEELIRDIVLMKLEAVGLRGAQALMPNQLSGGMARRVALARAIVLDPDLIMYDEPFTGLDPIAMGVIVKLIRELNTALGMTSIIVSHDVQEVMQIADYIYLIANGQVLGQGTPAEMQANKTPIVEQFIHGMPDGIVPFHYPGRPYQAELLGDDHNA